jgi:hypothetical protein
MQQDQSACYDALTSAWLQVLVSGDVQCHPLEHSPVMTQTNAAGQNVIDWA